MLGKDLVGLDFLSSFKFEIERSAELWRAYLKLIPPENLTLLFCILVRSRELI